MHQKFSCLLILQSPWRTEWTSAGLYRNGLSNLQIWMSLLNTWHIGHMPHHYALLHGPEVMFLIWGLERFISFPFFPAQFVSIFSCWFFSSFFFPPSGEGSCTPINHHTTGGHYPLWGCLFWIYGRPESVKWGVIWSACWKEGGCSWWQWFRVGRLLNTLNAIVSVGFFIILQGQTPLKIAVGTSQNDSDNWFHICFQKEHHCETAVPILWTPEGKHLYRRTEHPRRQPGQPEEVFGGRTSGLWNTNKTNEKKINVCVCVYIYLNAA